jgi:Arc/MetJ-type ribon-helix-helix transcriptional regulator
MTRKDELALLGALRVDIEKIDHLVETGQYTSRADFLRDAIERLLEDSTKRTYTAPLRALNMKRITS